MCPLHAHGSFLKILRDPYDKDPYDIGPMMVSQTDRQTETDIHKQIDLHCSMHTTKLLHATAYVEIDITTPYIDPTCHSHSTGIQGIDINISFRLRNPGLPPKT